LVYEDVRARPYFQFVDFEAAHVNRFTADISIPEMHDRIIVGVARRLNVPLLTSDIVIDANMAAHEFVW
jgi:hypothetical protein